MVQVFHDIDLIHNLGRAFKLLQNGFLGQAASERKWEPAHAGRELPRRRTRSRQVLQGQSTRTAAVASSAATAMQCESQCPLTFQSGVLQSFRHPQKSLDQSDQYNARR